MAQKYFSAAVRSVFCPKGPENWRTIDQQEIAANRRMQMRIRTFSPSSDHRRVSNALCFQAVEGLFSIPCVRVKFRS